MRSLTLIITNKSQLILCQRTRHSSLQLRYLHTICALCGICERECSVCNFLFSNLNKFTFKKKRFNILFPLSSSTRRLGPHPTLIGLTCLQVDSLNTLVYCKLKQLQNYFSIVFLYFIAMSHFEPYTQVTSRIALLWLPEKLLPIKLPIMILFNVSVSLENDIQIDYWN